MLILLLTSFTKGKPTEANSKIDADEIMKKTSEKLNDLKDVSYSYFRSINYFSEDYHSEAEGNTFINFDKLDTNSYLKFQVESDDSRIIYNGSEYFSMNKKDKTIAIKNQPNITSFENISFFYNSIITLRNSLPKIISNKEIQKKLTDTIINKTNYYLISFVLVNKTISSLGNFTPITLKRNFLYKIVIAKDSFLPLQVIQTNDVQPKDYTLTSFSNIKLKDNIPLELSWYYSSYTKEYQQKNLNRLTIINEKSIAPIFSLPDFESNDTISSSQLLGKFTLLEFWIKNCGYCIQAVQKLNILTNKFDKSTLEIIGINSYDNKNQIKSFYQAHRPFYKTLHDKNGKVSKDFGVDAFPQVVLLDKKRNVLYSGNLELNIIEKIVSEK